MKAGGEDVKQRMPGQVDNRSSFYPLAAMSLGMHVRRLKRK